MMPGFVDPLSQLAAYLAAVMHDFEHGGFTNEFLVQTSSDLAMCYSDRAPMVSNVVSICCFLL